jgi:hypothetical protein
MTDDAIKARSRKGSRCQCSNSPRIGGTATQWPPIGRCDGRYDPLRGEAYTARRQRADARVERAGDLRDPELLAELLTAILADHLEVPNEEVEYLAVTMNGYAPVREKVAQPFDPANCGTDDVAIGLALLIGHLRDAASAKKDAAA